MRMETLQSKRAAVVVTKDDDKKSKVERGRSDFVTPNIVSLPDALNYSQPPFRCSENHINTIGHSKLFW